MGVIFSESAPMAVLVEKDFDENRLCRGRRSNFDSIWDAWEISRGTASRF